MTVTLPASGGPPRPDATYARLEERILTRDQHGASDIFFDLVRQERPLPELLHEAVRIHAPYTHVPFHQRLDNGLVKFVNNDHCMLSARATLRLSALMPDNAFARLPMMQTIWYLPTGLDIWNQLLGKAPGHYTRMYQLDVSKAPPPPVVYWPDQTPVGTDGTLDERLNQWLTLVQCSEVLPAYEAFLGLMADVATDPEQRRKVLSHLVFGGLINVQDRMLFNRSYTTGHKAYRARATVELGDLVGWSDAHAILYAGVPDMAVGPHWYSAWEMAANVCQAQFEGREHDFRNNQGDLSAEEQATLEDALLHSYEPDWQNQVSALLTAGKGPRQLIDVLQVAASELMVQCGAPENYSMPQHTTEYCNTLRWYFDAFDHPHQVKLLYVAGSMVNTAAHNQAADPKNGPVTIGSVPGSDAWDRHQLLRGLDAAVLARDSDTSLALVRTYLRNGNPQADLIERLAVACAKFGNDPHNQEICLGLLEDFVTSTAARREVLLYACIKNLTGYRKYGDHFEAYNRYAEAFGLPVAETNA